MNAAVREGLILAGVCGVWTLIATPGLAEGLHRLQWTKAESSDEIDYVARARVSRCAVYTMCLCIFSAPRLEYPGNWLFILLAGPAFFGLCWAVLKKLGQ